MKTIAIVGKPNVGKSSLFNRIIKKNKSIVHDYAGVTRDRIYAEGEWLLKKFNIVDTGGLTSKNLTFQQNINEQVLFAIEEADIIIFLVSAINSLDAEDFYVNKILKKYKNNKKIILAANKADAKNKINESLFYQLGYGKPIFISCTHGIGIGNLLDEVVKYISIDNGEKENNNFSFCIIGKPNVGKSSTVNAILNKNQVIVSEVAGSTRDSTDSEFKYYGNDLTIIDTAGIKRKSKLKESLDKISYFKAEKAIKRSNLILFMLDGSIPFSEQDEVIGGLAFNANIPTIIVVNKIDLISNFDEHKRQQLINEIRIKFKFLSWAPIFFISSLQKKKLNLLIDLILKIKDKVKIKINNSLLNEVVSKAEMMNKPPLHNGNRISISYITQVKSQIPTFVIFCNNPKYLHFSYARYIENQIREAFDLTDVPVCLFWKEKNSKNRSIERKK